MLVFLVLAHISLIHIFLLEFRVECVDGLKIEVILVVNQFALVEVFEYGFRLELGEKVDLGNIVSVLVDR